MLQKLNKSLTVIKHAYVGYGNPYLTCKHCSARVAYWHDPDRCGCGEEAYNYPCGHDNDVKSKCITWTIVDGCCCEKPCKR